MSVGRVDWRRPGAEEDPQEGLIRALLGKLFTPLGRENPWTEDPLADHSDHPIQDIGLYERQRSMLPERTGAAPPEGPSMGGSGSGAVHPGRFESRTGMQALGDRFRGARQSVYEFFNPTPADVILEAATGPIPYSALKLGKGAMKAPKAVERTIGRGLGALDDVQVRGQQAPPVTPGRAGVQQDINIEAEAIEDRVAEQAADQFLERLEQLAKEAPVRPDAPNEPILERIAAHQIDTGYKPPTYPKTPYVPEPWKGGPKFEGEDGELLTKLLRDWKPKTNKNDEVVPGVWVPRRRPDLEAQERMTWNAGNLRAEDVPGSDRVLDQLDRAARLKAKPEETAWWIKERQEFDQLLPEIDPELHDEFRQLFQYGADFERRIGPFPSIDDEDALDGLKRGIREMLRRARKAKKDFQNASLTPEKEKKRRNRMAFNYLRRTDPELYKKIDEKELTWEEGTKELRKAYLRAVRGEIESFVPGWRQRPRMTERERFLWDRLNNAEKYQRERLSRFIAKRYELEPGSPTHTRYLEQFLRDSKARDALQQARIALEKNIDKAAEDVGETTRAINREARDAWTERELENEFQQIARVGESRRPKGVPPAVGGLDSEQGHLSEAAARQQQNTPNAQVLGDIQNPVLREKAREYYLQYDDVSGSSAGVPAKYSEMGVTPEGVRKADETYERNYKQEAQLHDDKNILTNLWNPEDFIESARSARTEKVLGPDLDDTVAQAIMDAVRLGPKTHELRSVPGGLGIQPGDIMDRRSLVNPLVQRRIKHDPRAFEELQELLVKMGREMPEDFEKPKPARSGVDHNWKARTVEVTKKGEGYAGSQAGLMGKRGKRKKFRKPEGKPVPNSVHMLGRPKQEFKIPPPPPGREPLQMPPALPTSPGSPRRRAQVAEQRQVRPPMPQAQNVRIGRPVSRERQGLPKKTIWQRMKEQGTLERIRDEIRRREAKRNEPKFKKPAADEGPMKPEHMTDARWRTLVGQAWKWIQNNKTPRNAHWTPEFREKMRQKPDYRADHWESPATEGPWSKNLSKSDYQAVMRAIRTLQARQIQ